MMLLINTVFVVPVTMATLSSDELPTKFVINTNGCSTFRATANLVMTAVGVGVLALPNAVALAGWVVGPLLLLLAWALTHFMMCLLWRCMYMNPEGSRFESYEAIGRRCFGIPGQIAVAVCLYGGIFCICSLMIILMGDTMTNLVPSLGRVPWILIFVGIIAPLSWLPSMNQIGVVSAIGVAATVVATVFVIIAGVREAVSDDTHVHSLVPHSVSGLGLAFTNFMNSFTCAPVIPELIDEMENPRKFPKVALWAFTIISVLFGSIGFAGYAGWGVDMLGYASIVDAVAASAGPGDAVNYVVQIAIAVVSAAHLLVLFTPLGRGAEVYAEVIAKRPLPRVIRLSCRTVALAGCTCLAIFVPGFGTLFNLVGSTIVMFLQIIFPVTFFVWLSYIGNKKGEDSDDSSSDKSLLPVKTLSQRLLFYVLLPACFCLGLFGLILGTYQGIEPLVE